MPFWDINELPGRDLAEINVCPVIAFVLESNQ